MKGDDVFFFDPKLEDVQLLIKEQNENEKIKNLRLYASRHKPEIMVGTYLMVNPALFKNPNDPDISEHERRNRLLTLEMRGIMFQTFEDGMQLRCL